MSAMHNMIPTTSGKGPSQQPTSESFNMPPCERTRAYRQQGPVENLSVDAESGDAHRQKSRSSVEESINEEKVGPCSTGCITYRVHLGFT